MNPNTQGRNGTLTIAGQVHSVTQQGRAATVCSYALAPPSAAYSKDARGWHFDGHVARGLHMDGEQQASWLTFTAGDRGAGNGSCVL